MLRSRGEGSLRMGVLSVRVSLMSSVRWLRWVFVCSIVRIVFFEMVLMVVRSLEGRSEELLCA